MKIRARIDYNLPAVQPKLREWGHPFAEEWTEHQLRHTLIIALVTDDDEIVGYVWYGWENVWAKRLWMHICVNPAYHGKWYTRRVRADLYHLARLCDAQYLLARAIDTRIAAKLCSAGFIYLQSSDWWFLSIPENRS